MVLTVQYFSEISLTAPISPSDVTTGSATEIPSSLPLSIINEQNGSLAVYERTLQGGERT